jgi:rSAM/selenodomain-associated transferase 1
MSSALRAEGAAAPVRTRIAVFAKAPIERSVKTRLAPALGPAGAARLHADLVRRTLATAVDAGVGEVELWCAPDAAHPFFADCARDFGVALREQVAGDLGARMAWAFRCALGDNAALVLVGSDCPVLTPGLLREAAAALATHDVVVAPAEDGGYVLVGLARADPGIFSGIAWGGGEVMAETRRRLEETGTRWKELETLWDIDRPEDYARFAREGLERPSS